MSRQKTPFVKFKPKELKDLTWRIIIEAWENGLSDREVSLRLSKTEGADNLSSKDISEMCKKHPEIKELKAGLQSDLVAAAKLTVADKIREGDVATAKWYLERKEPNEFSSKQAIAFENGVIELSIEDKEQTLKQYVEKFESDGK